MADIATSTSSVENLNNTNYYNGSVRVELILLGQDLQDIDRGHTKPPNGDAELKKRKVKSGKIMFLFAAIVGDELLQHIKDGKTPKEAWHTLASLFTKTNDTAGEAGE